MMKRYSRIIKFLVSGGSAALVEFFIFFVMTKYLSEKLINISQTVSFLSGFVVSFWLNKKWVFKSAGRVRDELKKYAVLAGINLVITNGLIALFVNHLGLNKLIIKVTLMICVAIWNYILFQKLIFKPKEYQTTIPKVE